MADPGACFLCTKEGRACDRGRPCSNCRARGVPQMCVGSELSARIPASNGSAYNSATRVKTSKTANTTTTKAPLKQIGPAQPASSSTTTASSKPPSDTKSTSKGSSTVGTSTRSTATDTKKNLHSIRSTQAPLSTPTTPYVNEDLTQAMDGISILYPLDTIDHTESDYQPDPSPAMDGIVFPSSSPPPESYMQIEPKRPRKRRDRYPEPQGLNTDVYGQPSTSTDLAPARISHDPTVLDMMSEISHLRMELDSARKQNDLLNRKLMRMAEGAHILNQLQQYMAHMKILPPETTQALSTHVNTSSNMTPVELEKFAPYAAFQDACMRYHDMPIVLFNLSQPIPVVALANEAFNSLFSTEAVNKPWISFISPAYLERTKQLLNNAAQHHAAVKFVQVYRDAMQKQFVALDVHRFYSIMNPSTNQRITMDLVFLVRSSQLTIPRTDDLMYWKAPLNESGQVDGLQSFTIPTTGGSTATASWGKPHIASSLTSSTGILLEPEMRDFSGDKFGKGLQIDELSSPSVVEVTTPPQDQEQYYSSIDGTYHVDPYLEDPSRWEVPDQWVSSSPNHMMTSGGFGAPTGLAGGSTHSGGVTIEEYSSPTGSPGFPSTSARPSPATPHSPSLSGSIVSPTFTSRAGPSMGTTAPSGQPEMDPSHWPSSPSQSWLAQPPNGFAPVGVPSPTGTRSNDYDMMLSSDGLRPGFGHPLGMEDPNFDTFLTHSGNLDPSGFNSPMTRK